MTARFTARDHRGPATRRAATWAAAVFAALSAGCRPAAPPAPDAARDEQVRGPLRLTVTAAPRRPLVGDRVTVTISFEAPEGYRATLPGPDALAPLAAQAGEAFDERPAAAGRLWRRTFAFEPLAAGPLDLPALTVAYVPPPPAAVTSGPATQPTSEPVAVRAGCRPSPGCEAGACCQTNQELALQARMPGELVSGALRIDVRSALSDKDQPTQPRDITGPVVPPAPPRPWWAWALLALGLAAAIGATALTVRVLRRRAARPPPPLSPEEWALRELARLAERDWLARGAARELYYRVTEIVRQYIERKFALAAPEMTTEEFLATLDRRPLPLDTDRLRAFLEACDLVKYAALEPGPADIDRTLATARAFVAAGAPAAAALSAAGAPP